MQATTPFTLIAEAFTELADEPNAIAVDGRDLPGLPDRALSLHEIADRLTDRDTSLEAKDAVWARLVTWARLQPSPWTILCAALALPGLRGAVRKAAWSAPDFADRSDIESAAIEGFIAALADTDLLRPRIIRRLCNAAHTNARRYAIELGRYQETLSSSVYESHPPRKSAGHVDFVLARAVRDGAIDENDVRMIQDTFLDGMSVNDYAETHGLSPDQVTRWRRHVRENLAEWFRFNNSPLPSTPVQKETIQAVPHGGHCGEYRRGNHGANLLRQPIQGHPSSV